MPDPRLTQEDAPSPAAAPAAPAQARNPLHGVTLERMLEELVARLGWAEMGRRVRINCFTSDPSIASSLRFLRRTPWARAEVEALYTKTMRRG